MSTTSIFWIMGIIIGVLVSLLVIKAFNSDGRIKTKYDERQIAARGKAYMYSFYAVIITNALMMVIDVGDENLFSYGAMIMSIPICVGIAVQVTVSIFKDAYIGMNNNFKKYMIFMCGISAFNLMVGIRPLFTGDMIVDGKLQSPFVSLMVGLMFIVIAVDFMIKRIIDGREE